MTLYRITDRCDKTVCTFQHIHDRNGYRRHWRVAEPALYVFLQGGLSRAYYECPKDEADGALFDINLFGDSDE